MPVRYSLFALVISACGCLHAGPCVPATLFVYDNLPPSGCTIGQLTANNFSFSVLSSVGVATPLTDTQITITPTFGGRALGSFNFASSGFNVGMSQSIQYLIAYTLAGHADIQSMDDIMGPAFATNGLANVTTLGCVGAAFVGSTCSTSTATVMVFDNNGTTQFTNSTNITPSQILGIRQTITLQAGSGAGSGAGFDSFGSQASIPEPATWLSCAAALALLAVRLRRVRARLHP
jgi:hypothetical protein